MFPDYYQVFLIIFDENYERFQLNHFWTINEKSIDSRASTKPHYGGNETEGRPWTGSQRRPKTREKNNTLCNVLEKCHTSVENR